MRIATYNLLKGGSGRSHWTRLIENFGVDLLLVQESYRHEQYLPPLLYPTARSQSVCGTVKQNGWGSAVFAKAATLESVTVPGFEGWVVGAEVHDAPWHASPLFVFSLHAPSGKESYAKAVNLILDEIRRVAGGRPVILGGDFNLTVSHWPGSERPISKQDLAIQARLADEFGLLNCWQTANPDQALHQTLRWTKDRKIPFHCDGLFVPTGWKDRLDSCVVLSGDEWTRLSDHNPVMASFRDV